MKILSLTSERDDANAVAAALHVSFPEATVTWAARFEDAACWMGVNGDVEAVVLDARLGDEACGAFVQRLRQSGLTVPAIMLVPAGAGTEKASKSLSMSGDDRALACAASLHELTHALRRVSEQTQSAGAATLPDDGFGTSAHNPSASGTQLAKQTKLFAASLGELVKKRTVLERRVLELEEAVEHLTRERAAEVESAATRQRDAEARLAEAMAERDEACRLVDATTTQLRHAEVELERADAEVTALLARLTNSDELVKAAEVTHAQHIRQLSDECGGVRQELVAALLTSERLRHREAELTEALAVLTLARDQAVFELEVARRDSVEAAGRASADRDALEQQLHADATAERFDWKRRLDEVQGALEVARAQHASALAELDARIRRQLELEAELTDRASALDEQRARAERERQEASARLDAVSLACDAGSQALDTARDASRVLRERVDALEHQLADVERARRDADGALARERAAATDERTSLTDRLELESRERRALEARVREADTTHQDSVREQAAAMFAAARVAEQLAEREREMERERGLRRCDEARWKEREAELKARLDETAVVRSGLERDLHAEVVRRETLEQERDTLKTSLGESRKETERSRCEHASAATYLERQIAEAEAQHSELAARHAAAERAHDQALAQLRDNLAAATTLHQAEVELVRADRAKTARELEDVTRDVEAVRQERDALRERADRATLLQREHANLLAELEQRFDEYPLPLCRCTRDGRPTRVNRAFAELLGFAPEEVDGALDAAIALFSSSGDVSWLLQHLGTPEAEEPVETVWKSAQGRRVAVRLSAAVLADATEILALDVSENTALCERLERARRMEAVGRLASEVAATCHASLEDVRRSAQGCLGTLDGQSSQKLRMELILTDVGRALDQLSRLDAYGRDQADAVEPVDLTRTLRGLEPLLKEVAGDDIEIVLPKRSWLKTREFYVDVREERVERVLVNVAAFARQRMLRGGVVTFELEATQVDRAFVEQHPGTRPGAHAILTVKEVEGQPRSLVSLKTPDVRSEQRAELSGDDPVSVDLGSLQDLVRTSNGHLWVEASSGRLTIRIHLPSATREERRWSPVSAVFRRGA